MEIIVSYENPDVSRAEILAEVHRRKAPTRQMDIEELREEIRND